MVKRRNLRRKGNGHHRIDPGLSRGMQTVGRSHQFFSGRRAHHNVRVGIEGNHDRLTAMGTGITDKRFDEFLVSTVNAVEHANGDRCGTRVLTLIKRIGSNDASSSDSPAKKTRASSRADNIIEHRRLPAETRAP